MKRRDFIFVASASLGLAGAETVASLPRTGDVEGSRTILGRVVACGPYNCEGGFSTTPCDWSYWFYDKCWERSHCPAEACTGLTCDQGHSCGVQDCDSYVTLGLLGTENRPVDPTSCEGYELYDSFSCSDYAWLDGQHNCDEFTANPTGAGGGYAEIREVRRLLAGILDAKRTQS